ncbi:MAG: prepilin peptidase [Moritella sp.]|uniref:prepilin peptidase n=1 Tax=Moritella sp. TaxID=78556 RepID=UPI0025FABD86|nr:prepilin peptidase [Moritella sp.]NQZ92108.1 prepilin peptidase [Moritella sp.]
MASFYLQALGWLIIAILSCLICYQDFKARKVRNDIVMVLAVVTCSLMILTGNYAAVYVCLGLFLGGLLLTQINVIAAGDIKLLMAFSLAIKPDLILLTFVVIGFTGGLLAVVYYLSICMNKLSNQDNGIPYAIPICFSSVLAIAASL